MPSKTKYDAIARQWQLMKFLPARGYGVTAKELVERLADSGYTLTKRTVERDLNELSRLFPIECNDKSMPFGWRWMQDASADLPSITVAEALSLKLLDGFIRPLLPKAIRETLAVQFRLADQKLTELQGSNRHSRLKDLVRVVPASLDLLPPDIDPTIQETVQQALIDGEQIDATYHAASDASAKKLTLHPLALVQRGPVTYLVATASKYIDIRMYALHRFRAVDRAGRPVSRPRGFTIDGYISSGAFNFGDGRPLKLRISVTADVARFLAETPLSADMKIKQQGERYAVTATVQDTLQLRWWLLSFGPQIRVDQPKSLGNEVHASLKRAADQYD